MTRFLKKNYVTQISEIQSNFLILDSSSRYKRKNIERCHLRSSKQNHRTLFIDIVELLLLSLIAVVPHRDPAECNRAIVERTLGERRPIKLHLIGCTRRWASRWEIDRLLSDRYHLSITVIIGSDCIVGHVQSAAASRLLRPVLSLPLRSHDNYATAIA
jgi:hypothetical protein